MIRVLFVTVFLLIGCASTPKLNSQQIRPWSSSLEKEYPNEKAVIAHYQKDGFDLFYLAARHTNTFGEDTLNLVEKLFNQFKFDVILIESIPFSSGESPSWFLEEAKKGQTEKFILGGESSLAVILASENKIPFYAGEPDHQDIYQGLKKRGYTDEDIIGFYTVRQIPQWVREREEKKDLLKRKIPPFANYYCKLFQISSCPTYEGILSWYRKKLGHELISDISNEEVGPYSDGKLFTQKISSDVGFIRDHFTLNIIEQMLLKYKKVAVVYGAGHLVTLRKSFDKTFGPPTFIEDTGR